MNEALGTIKETIVAIDTIVAAIVSLVIGIISGYLLIRDKIRKEIISYNAIRDKVIPLALQVEDEDRLEKIKSTIFHDDIPKGMTDNEQRNFVVSNMAMENTDPKDRKRLGVTDYLKMGELVSSIYSIIKPAIKVLKK